MQYPDTTEIKKRLDKLESNYGVDPIYKELCEQYREEAQRLDAVVHSLTRALCDTGRALHNNTEIPSYVQEWWVKHRKCDEERGESW